MLVCKNGQVIHPDIPLGSCGEPSTAVASSLDALDVRAASTALGVIADIYLRMGRFPEAIGALRQALPEFRAHHARRHTALCLVKLGYAHEALRRYPEAIDYLSQARDAFGELGLTGKVESAQQALRG